MLLDFEPHPGDQIKLLLSMGEEELALQKAINSMDHDLVALALLHIQESRMKSQRSDAFFKMVALFPDATNLLRVYYRGRASATDRSLLHNFAVARGAYLEAGPWSQCVGSVEPV